MKREAAEILKDALRLPTQPRAALAGSPLESLDTEVDEDAEAAWATEVNRRVAELDSAAVKTIPWAEVRRPPHRALTRPETASTSTRITQRPSLGPGAMSARLPEYPRTGIIVKCVVSRPPTRSRCTGSGSATRDFLSFPATVKDDMGNALGIAQFGGTAPTAKPWKGLGPGVLEIVESHDGNAYRAVYTVRFEKRCTCSTRSRRSRRPASGRPNGMWIWSSKD